MSNTDIIKRRIEKSKRLLYLSAGLFNCVMLFMVAHISRLSRNFAILMVFLWFVLLICIIVFNHNVKKDEKALKGIEIEKISQ